MLNTVPINSFLGHQTDSMSYNATCMTGGTKPMDIEDSLECNDDGYEMDTDMKEPAHVVWYPETKNTLHFMGRLNDTHQDTKNTRLFRVDLQGNGQSREASVVLVDPQGVARIATTVYSGNQSFLVVPVDQLHTRNEPVFSTALARPLLSLHQILMGVSTKYNFYQVLIPIENAHSTIELAMRQGLFSLVPNHWMSLALLQKHQPMITSDTIDASFATNEQPSFGQNIWPTWDQRLSAMIHPLSGQHLVKSLSATIFLKTFLAKIMNQARPVKKRSFHHSFSSKTEAMNKRARVTKPLADSSASKHTAKSVSRMAKKARRNGPIKQDIRYVVLNSLLLAKGNSSLSRSKRHGVHFGSMRPMKRTRLMAQ